VNTTRRALQPPERSHSRALRLPKFKAAGTGQLLTDILVTARWLPWGHSEASLPHTHKQRFTE
jgi:hypothetical protein